MLAVPRASSEYFQKVIILYSIIYNSFWAHHRIENHRFWLVPYVRKWTHDFKCPFVVYLPKGLVKFSVKFNTQKRVCLYYIRLFNIIIVDKGILTFLFGEGNGFIYFWVKKSRNTWEKAYIHFQNIYFHDSIV